MRIGEREAFSHCTKPAGCGGRPSARARCSLFSFSTSDYRYSLWHSHADAFGRLRVSSLLLLWYVVVAAAVVAVVVLVVVAA